MQRLGSFPPEHLKIVIEFLKKENLAYRTSQELIPFGHTTVPSGNVILDAEDMDAFQQIEYAKVAMRTLN
jgi:hypothetical protein